MRNRITLLTVALLSAITITSVIFTISAKAEQNDFNRPEIIRCTCYCDYGVTRSGAYTRPGIIAGKKEWLGKVAALYEIADDGSLGDFIGYYEFLDTGYGINGSLIDGTSVDVWQPSLDACYDWISEYGDYVYMQIIEGEG